MHARSPSLKKTCDSSLQLWLKVPPNSALTTGSKPDYATDYFTIRSL